MARTYNLTATSVNAGMHSGWGSGDWNNFFSANVLSNASLRRPYVGRYGDSPYTYRAVNILFDPAVLATLRTKTITSIKLTVTLVYGTLYPSSSAYKIGYKLDAQASTSSAGTAWTRSDANSSAASSTEVAGYLSTAERIESDNDNIPVTVDLTGSTIPRYGYTIGTDQGLNASIILGATATLTVVTNESLTLSFNANGGSGAPSSQTADGNPNHTFAIPSTVPTRQYYTFLGWSTSSSATSASYSAGGSITISANTTLYAVWRRNTATVTYNANGGTGAPSATTHDEGTNVTLSSTKPTRTGYNFLGWSTSSSASSASYAAGGTYALYTTVTLYAVWERITYTVTYNANGGSGAPSAQTKTYDVTLTLSSTTPSRTGYTFLGWSTSNTATSASYQPGGSFTANANTTLYAVWKIITYSVTFNANGGTGAPAAQTKTYGVDLTLSSTKPTRTNYAFLGWSTDSGATTTQYAAGGKYTANAAAVLYAVWQLNAFTITLSYDANSGTGAPSADSKTNTLPISFTVSNTVPTREGYVFLGWADSADATAAAYHGGDTLSLSANKTLYAVWQRQYVITYNANGGSGAPAAQRKTQGVDLVLSSTEPTRDGYAFFGWSADSSAFNATWQPGDTYSTDADITLYAVWRALYSVSYDANGGTGAPTAQTKTQGVDLVLSSVEPTWTSKTFMSWQGSDGRSYNAGDTYTGDADLVLTAVWNNFNKGSAYLVTNGVAHAVDVYVVENGVPVQKDIYV